MTVTLRAAGLGVGVLAIGLSLVWLSVPRFFGSVEALPARSVLWEIREDRPVTGERFARGAAALESSARWGGTPAHVLSDLALLRLLQFDSAKDASATQAQFLLTQSLEAQDGGLGQAPAGTNGWARLAYARYMNSGVTEGVRDALEMSLLTGGVDLALVSFRFQLILREWDALGPEFHGAAQGEVLRLARHGDSGYDVLVDSYLASSQGEIVDSLLSRWPVHHAGFATRLERRVGTP